MRIPSLAAVALFFAALLSGCGTSSSGGSSDTSDAGTDPLGRSVGSPCSDSAELVCELDAQQSPTGEVLACQNGAFAKSFSCNGTCGTLSGHGGVRCGSATLVAVGGQCDAEGSAACVPDRSVVAVCQHSVWTEGHHCGSPTCDFFTGSDGVARAQCGAEDLYSIGDLCTFPFGHGVCSVDHTAVLDCQADGTTKVLYACTAPQSCKRVEIDAGPAIECSP